MGLGQESDKQRTARLYVPGFLHHVMIRRIEGRKIFRNNKDSENFSEKGRINRKKIQIFA